MRGSGESRDRILRLTGLMDVTKNDSRDQHCGDTIPLDRLHRRSALCLTQRRKYE